MTTLAFLLVAAAGSVVRAVATSSASIDRRLAGTFTVNVVGAFLLGLLGESGAGARLVLGVAGLGAFTTFSAFVAQLDELLATGRGRDAILYAVASLAGGIGAAWVGVSVAL